MDEKVINVVSRVLHPLRSLRFTKMATLIVAVRVFMQNACLECQRNKKVMDLPDRK